MANIPPHASIELLENRIAPAGVVTIDFAHFGYEVHGDDADNDLLVRQEGSLVTFTPLNGTQLLVNFGSGTHTASTSPVSIGFFGKQDLSIDMGSGKDTLELDRLTLPGNFDVDTGFNTDQHLAESVTINDLRVGGSFDLHAWEGNVSITGDTLYAGKNLKLYSSGTGLSADVGAVFAGNALSLKTLLGHTDDRFTIRAGSIVAMRGADVDSSIFADVPVGAVSIIADSLFSVSGSLKIHADGAGSGATVLSSPVFDVSQKLLVQNNTAAEALGVRIEDSGFVHVGGGISVTGKSPGSTVLSITADSVDVSGGASLKLPKSSGGLTINAESLNVGGGVSFSTKGIGLLELKGDGDIFGKVNAALNAGMGQVTIGGVNIGLATDSIKITSPAGLPTTGTGVTADIHQTNVVGSLAVILGNGEDHVDLNDNFVNGGALIATGGGNDTVNLHTNGTHISVFNKGVGISLGAGNDTLTLGYAEAVNTTRALYLCGIKGFDGGAGTDTIAYEGRNVVFLKSFGSNTVLLPIVRGFEPQA